MFLKCCFIASEMLKVHTAEDRGGIKADCWVQKNSKMEFILRLSGNGRSALMLWGAVMCSDCTVSQGQMGWGCARPALNAEPLGLLPCTLHMMAQSSAHTTVSAASYPDKLESGTEWWSNECSLLCWHLQEQGLANGAVGRWVHSRSLSAFPACGSSASEILLLISPPRPPVQCQEHLRAVVTPKSFHRNLWDSLFYSPTRVHEYQEYYSCIHPPTMSLNFLGSLEGWVQNCLPVSEKLGKIRCSEV